MGVWKRKKFLVAGALAAVLVAFGGMLIPSGDTYADDDDAFTTCASSGAAESLGWIICPIMDMMGNASEGLYNGAVKPALQVEPKLFTRKAINDDGDKVIMTQQAWGTFRDIANGLLIALFLVVIFSQLTGVGIDNYGIKKILPKIIVAAILMNLSYWVCVAFVDLSNILGNSIQSLFDGLADNFNFRVDTLEDGSGGTADIDGAIASGGTTLLSVAIIGAIVAGGGYAILSNPAILLGVLVGAIGVIVSIFFLFILLSVREAAIVVLVVLSPLAIACYMLPNTKNLFDKWLKLFEALLLVYPICGLLVGGGNYVSTLLLKVSVSSHTVNIFPTITAMVVGIVPIFFFPTVLKNAFAGLGNLGAKITGMGDRVGSRLQGATQNSRAYKYAQERGRERQTRWNAGLDKNGKPIDYDNVRGGALRRRIGRVMRISDNNTAKSRAQYLRDQDSNMRDDRLMGVGFDAARVAQTKRAEGDEVADYMTLINSETRNGEDEGALFSKFDEYMASGNTAGAVAVARIAGRRKDTAASFAQDKLTSAGEGGPSIANMYDPEMLQAVAKEVSTGENSGQYRSSAPMAFEFAAQTNRGTAGTQDYNTWSSNPENVSRAMNNYVTNSQEMVGLKNSSLSEIAGMMENGQMDAATATRLKTLAQDTINNKDTTGVWDSTKAENIQRIASYTLPSGGGDAGATAGGAATTTEAAARAEAAVAGGVAAGAAAASMNVAAGVGVDDGTIGESAGVISSSTPQAAGAAVGNHAAAGGAGDNSGELTIQHDDGGAGAGAASGAGTASGAAGAGAATTVAAAASAVHSRATAAQTSTPAQSRLEIAHSMNDARLREAQRNVDAQNQGNRQWPGNPQTPRGI